MTYNRHANIKWIASLILVALMLNVGQVVAIEINVSGLQGSLDTTISYGQLYRVQSRAANLTGVINGGTALSVNGDDGNLNYDTGLVSNTIKLTTELDLAYKSTGFFIRGFGFKDTHAHETFRTQLSEKAERLVESNIVLRDAYLWQDLI